MTLPIRLKISKDIFFHYNEFHKVVNLIYFDDDEVFFKIDGVAKDLFVSFPKDVFNVQDSIRNLCKSYPQTKHEFIQKKSQEFVEELIDKKILIPA